jgi:hypothetical protein
MTLELAALVDSSREVVRCFVVDARRDGPDIQNMIALLHHMCMLYLQHKI